MFDTSIISKIINWVYFDITGVNVFTTDDIRKRIKSASNFIISAINSNKIVAINVGNAGVFSIDPHTTSVSVCYKTGVVITRDHADFAIDGEVKQSLYYGETAYIGKMIDLLAERDSLNRELEALLR